MSALVAAAGRRTLASVDAAEAIGSGCAWLLFAAVPFAVGFLVALVWPWTGATIGLVGVGGALLLRRMARLRAERARPLLEGFDEVVLPTWSRPMQVPRGERDEGAGRRVWRVHGVRHPNGRTITAEVVVQQDTGNAWFVVWPVRQPRPRETRSFDMVLEPVLGGYLVSSPDPDATAEHLRDPVVRELLLELLDEHDEVSVYPFAAWWRTRAPATRAHLRATELRLAQLAEVLHEAASHRL